MNPIVEDGRVLQNNQLLENHADVTLISGSSYKNDSLAPPIPTSNSKTRLMLMLNKKQEQSFEMHFSLKSLPTSAGFQFRLSLLGSLGELLVDRSWDGDERPAKKEAEYSAIEKFLVDEEALAVFARWKTVASVRSPAMEAASSNVTGPESDSAVPTLAAADPAGSKVQLMMRLQRKGVVGFDSHVSLDDLPRADRQFQCAMRMSYLVQLGPWKGEVCGSKKAAQNSAISAFLSDAEAMKAFEAWFPNDRWPVVDTTSAVSSSSRAINNSGQNLSVAPITASNSKTRLMLMLNKKQEQCFETNFSLNYLPISTGFKVRLSLLGSLGELLVDRSWDGDERPVKKEAEYSAIEKFLADEEALAVFARWKTAAIAASSNVTGPASNSAVPTLAAADPAGSKVQLMMRLQRKGVVGFDSHVSLDDLPSTNHQQFQCAMRMPCLIHFGSWKGGVCGSKKAAQNSAISAFLSDAEAMKAFEAWSPSVGGSVDEDANSETTTQASGDSASPLLVDHKSQLMTLLREVGIAKQSGYVSYETVRSVGPPSSYLTTVRVRDILVGWEFPGTSQKTARLAEQSAVESLLLNEEAIDIIRDFSGGEALDDCESVSSDITTSVTGAQSLRSNSKGRLLELVQAKVSGAKKVVVFETQLHLTSFCCTISIEELFPGEKFCGPPRQSKKEAEHAAADEMLNNDELYGALLNWQPRGQVFTLPVESVLCVQCSTVLGGADDFMFFADTQFVLKPELFLFRIGVDEDCPVNAIPHKDGPLKKTVVCNNCQTHLAVQLATGPNSASVIGFKMEAICTEHGPFTFKSWSEASRCFTDQFERRDFANYISKPVAAVGRPVFPMRSLVLVGGGSVAVDPQAAFAWLDLFPSDMAYPPYDYQIEAFRLSLMHNLVVVIPTGAGKTLIAAMAMKRMKLLNPARMVVMIVDRIPLVEQQSKAILKATELNLFGLCSATNTRQVRRMILEGRYDGIVVTAGLLIEWLGAAVELQQVQVEDFSLMVFDECHHVTGEHNYSKILELVSNVAFPNRPMLLGLSASPTQAKNEESACRKLAKLRDEFIDGKIYKPKQRIETTSVVNTIEIPKEPTEQQKKQQLSLADKLWTQYMLLRNSVGNDMSSDASELTKSSCNDSSKWSQFQMIASDPLHYENAHAKAMRRSVRDLQVNYLLGPVFLSETMTNGSHRDVLCWIKGEFLRDKGEELVDGGDDEEGDLVLSSEECEHFLRSCSSQLVELYERLTKCTDSNKILVFVETRHNARLLDQALRVLLPRFNNAKIIGQNNLDGMRWTGRDGQREVLNRFRGGEVRLIVCTSVLEEGLDVPDCDCVFRFGGRPSLIQLIQSKGRARARNGEGKLFLIYTFEEEAHFETIQRQEAFIDSALRSQTVTFDEAYLQRSSAPEEERSTLEAYDAEAMHAIQENMAENAERSGGPGEFCLHKFCLPLFVSSSTPFLQSEILSSLSLSGAVSEVSLVEVFPGAARAHLPSAGRLFGDEDSAALVSLSSDRSDMLYFLRLLATIWSFTVNVGGSSAAVSVPLSCLKKKKKVVDSEGDSEESEEQATSTLSRVLSVSTGYFESQNVFVPQGLLGDHAVRYDRVVIETGTELQLVGVAAGSDSQKAVAVVAVSVSSLGSCVYVSADKTSSTFTVFLTLKSAPRVCDGSKSRVFCPNYLEGEGDSSDGLQRDLGLLSRCPVVAISFHDSQWKSIVTILADAQILGVPALLTKVTISEISNAEFGSFSELNGDTFQGNGSFEYVHRQCVWMFATLQSNPHILSLNPDSLAHIQKTLDAVLVTRDLQAAVHVFKAMEQLLLALGDAHQWKRAIPLFDDLLQSSQSSYQKSTPVDARSQIEGVVPDGYQLVRRVVATPSRLHILPSTHIKTNRLVRMFGEQHVFVYVYFCDEQGQAIYDKAVFTNRFKDMFERGFDLCGQHFQFAACSNSQLRERTCVFVLGDAATVRAIRDQLVDPSLLHLKGVVKYISRLGLFCTADYDRTELDGTRVFTISDIHTADGKILTDGCGRISEAFMRLVCAEFIAEFGYCPVLIQFRAMGCKGTLLIDLNMPAECDVQFRDSNFKCSSSHMTLCVVKEAVYNPMRLNREGINLMCALGGEGCRGGLYDPHFRVMQLLKETLDGISQMLLNQDVALERLSRFFDAKVIKQLVDAKVNVLTEPHWWSVLQLIYLQETRALRKKTHIPVRDACLPMGAADPSGLLKDGEIFLKVVRPRIDQPVGEIVEYEEIVITGSVVIFRNPCLDPGDIRVVQAVDIPELRVFPNIVLLPASSGITRSLSAECSGGDLDGDQFSVIWDQGLVPPISRQAEAVDYAHVATSRAASQKVDANMTEADFIVSTMCNASLGRIANLHLALCDQLESGAMDKLARMVAVEQSIAVDSVKTGVLPDVPQEAKEMVKRKGHPDFMENKTKMSYRSNKLLGKLYHKVCAVSCDIEFMSREVDFSRDSSFLMVVSDALQEAVGAIYESFAASVRQLMVQYKLRSEAELVLGSPYEWADDFALDHVSSATDLAASWKELHAVYHKKFINFDFGSEAADRASLAAAWYSAAYRDKEAFHSFAWIVADYLAMNRIKSLAEGERLLQGDSVGVDDVVVAAIGGNALSHFKGGMSCLKRTVKSKLKVLKTVRQAIEDNVQVPQGSELTVGLYGSVSLLTCDFDSDIDMFVALSSYPCDSQQKQGLFLESLVYSAVDGRKKQKFFGSEVPIIKLELEEREVVTSVDICAKEDGMHKTRYIRALYAHNPTVLPLFCLVKQWAQHSGLVRGFKTDKLAATLNSGQLQALVLHYLEQTRDEIIIPSGRESVEDAALFAAVNNCDSVAFGRLLLGFFQYFAKHSASSLEYTWPVECRAVHKIDQKDMQVVSSRCERACHYLAVTRDWAFLLEQCARYNESVTNMSITLSRMLSGQIADNAEYHAQRLQFASGAEVSIAPESDLRDACLVVRGHGTCHQIQQLRAELLKLVRDGRALAYGALAPKSGVYFMENSTLLAARHMDSPDAMVKLNSLFDRQLSVHARHATRELSTLALTSSRSDSWSDEFGTSLVDKVVEQLGRMDEKTSHDLEFSVHFGVFYMLNASHAFNKQRSVVPLSDVQLAMTNGRRNRQFDCVERAEYDDTSRVKVKSTSSKSEESRASTSGKSSGGGSGGGSGKPAKAKTSPPRAQSRVTTSFMSSIPLPPTAPDEVSALCAPEGELRDMETRFRDLAKRLGYAEYVVVDEESTRREDEEVLEVVPRTALRVPRCRCFIVEVNPSPSYSVTACLDDRLRVFKVKERMLSYVHATLLSADKREATEDAQSSDVVIVPDHIQQFRKHDVRFKIGTSKAVETTSGLHEEACPDGQAPISLREDGRVVPSDVMKVKEKVAFVRQIHKKVYFVSQSYAEHLERPEMGEGESLGPPVTMLIFAHGTHFSGEDGLGDAQPFVDLSVEVDTAPLTRWVEGGLGEEEVRVWLEQVAREVLRVSEVIRGEW